MTAKDAVAVDAAGMGAEDVTGTESGK